MGLRNLVGDFFDWYFEVDCEWSFKLHKYLACCCLKHFGLVGFENETYVGMAHFGCFVGIEQNIDQDHPNHQDWLS